MNLSELTVKFNNICRPEHYSEEGIQSWWKGYASAWADEGSVSDEALASFINFVTKALESKKTEQKAQIYPINLYNKIFRAPTNSDLDKVKVEDFIKVCTSGERFWVKVQEIKGNTFIGIVDNNLTCTDKHGLTYGDTIRIEKRYVYDIRGGKNGTT